MSTWRLSPGDLRAVRAARHEFSLYLSSMDVGDDDGYDATLIFGELVANAVKCARHSVVVELLANGWWTLRIVDDGDCFGVESIAPRPLYAERGRGLYIASQLSRDLRVSRREVKGHNIRGF